MRGLIWCVAGVLAAAVSALGQERHSVVVAAPVQDVWAGFTTPEGVKRSWGVDHARVDLRVGGSIRTGRGEAARAQATHTILSYEPERMISLKAEAPAGAPEAVKAMCDKAWSVVRLEPVAPDRTRVTWTLMGVEGEEGLKPFHEAHAAALESMQKAFGDGKEQAAAAMEKLRWFAEGEWVSENTRSNGTVFRVRNWLRPIMDGKFIVSDGWLGDDRGMFHHAHMIAGIDPATGGVAFWNLGDAADITRGHIGLKDKDTLALDWTAHTADGKAHPYYIEMTSLDQDRYRAAAWASAEAHQRGEKPQLDVTYTRVAEAPEVFKKMREPEGQKVAP